MADDDLRLRQVILGHLRGLTSPQGHVYEGRRGDIIQAQSREDYEWLLSLRIKG